MPPTAPRVRRCAAVICVLLLSGCATPNSEPGKRNIGLVETLASSLAGPTTPPPGTLGAITGRVVDEADAPIWGAHASLFGTDHGMDTNASGAFQFTALPPGEYLLRVDHRYYHAAQADILVEAGKTTPLSVRLTLRGSVSASDRPHTHDYWVGRTRVVIMDEDVRYHPQRSGGIEGPLQGYTGPAEHAYNSACLAGKEIRTGASSLIQFPDDRQLIWPGTDQIEVTLDWDVDDYVGDKLSVIWHPANSREYKRSPLFPKGTTYSIPVLAREPDAGHQRFTSWEIALCTSEAGETGSYGRPFPGSVNVKLELVGGRRIPAEPPHPEFWQNGSRVALINETKVIPYSPNQYWLTTARGGRADFTFYPPAGNLVPPETAQLEARLSWTYDDPLDARPITLTYSPGSVAPWNRWRLHDRIMPEPVEEGLNVRTYVIDVGPTDNDTVYQEISNWAFYWNFEGEEQQDYAFHSCVCRLQIDFEVFAVRGPQATD